MVRIRKLTTLLTGIRPSRNLDSDKPDSQRVTTNTEDRRTAKRTRGDLAEDLALKYFSARGFELVQRNFNCRLGEIDLIMLDQKSLVFIEVRYRTSSQFGGALESITPAKQAKLRRAAQMFLLATKNSDCPCRFDILCVSGNLRKPDYQWIENAI